MKRLLMLLLSVFSGLSVYASSERVISDEALESFVDSKLRMASEMAEHNLPVTSSYMKSSMKAEPFSVDLAGLDRLVLLTEGGEDGSGWDHAVWAEARLVRKDGTSVWLDEIPYAYAKAGEGEVLYNKNQDGRPIVVAGTRYGHALFCHADGMIIYDLSKEDFVRFEALVGIDDTSAAGSVYFKAVDRLPWDYLKDLSERYPADRQLMNSIFGNMDEWMKTDGIETEVVRHMASRLDDSSYYMGVLKNLQLEKDSRTRIKSLIRLIESIRKTLELQLELQWLNIQSVRLAYQDMCSYKGFDSEKYSPMLEELSSLCAEGFTGI